MRIAGKDESVKHCAIAGTGTIGAITRRKLALAGLKRSRNNDQKVEILLDCEQLHHQ